MKKTEPQDLAQLIKDEAAALDKRYPRGWKYFTQPYPCSQAESLNYFRGKPIPKFMDIERTPQKTKILFYQSATNRRTPYIIEIYKV